MANFMGQNTGQLGLIAGQGDQSARHIDIPAGQGEGVDNRRVQHGETKAVSGIFGMGAEFAADAGDIVGQAFQIVGATELPADFGVFLGAQAAFIFGAEQYQIDIAGRRVDRAPSQRHRRDQANAAPIRCLSKPAIFPMLAIAHPCETTRAKSLLKALGARRAPVNTPKALSARGGSGSGPPHCGGESSHGHAPPAPPGAPVQSPRRRTPAPFWRPPRR